MVGLLRTSCVPGVSAAGPEISELSNRFTGNDATANTTRSGRRSWLKPSAALLGKRARVVKVTTREESSCSPMARHCSDQSIGRSVRRLTQNPRGRRPSIAAFAKTGEMNARDSEEGLQWIAVPSISWVRPAAELAPAVPGRALAVDRGVLAHRRNADPIGERDVAQRKFAQQVRYGRAFE